MVGCGSLPGIRRKKIKTSFFCVCVCVCVRACVRACVCCQYSLIILQGTCLEHSLEYAFFYLWSLLLVSCNNLQCIEIVL